MRITGFFSRIRRILLLGQRRERLKFALNAWLQDPSLYPLEAYPRFDVRLCVRTFLRNLTMMHWYVKANGSRPLTYLQPFNGLGVRKMSPRDRASVAHLRRRITVDGINEWDAMREFYGQAAADFRRLGSDEFHDLTDVFDHCSVETDTYIDQVHCSDRGYDLIAKRIAEDILKQEERVPECASDRPSRFLEPAQAEAEYGTDKVSSEAR